MSHQLLKSRLANSIIQERDSKCVTKPMWSNILEFKFTAKLIDQNPGLPAAFPCPTKSGEEKIISFLPTGLLPVTQSLQTLWCQRNEAVLETFALMNMQFPSPCYLNDIRCF